MSLRLILIFVICLSNGLIFCQQIKFNTKITSRIDWGNKVTFQYETYIQEDQSIQNLSILNKFDSDNQFLENNEHRFVYFIIGNLLNEKFVGYNQENGKMLSLDQVKERLTWNYSINYDHGDTIRKIYYEDFKYLQLHQEWIIDTSNKIKNKLTGISLIRYVVGQEKVIVYIPLNNNYISSKSVLNKNSIIYCRELRSGHKMEVFPKQTLMQLFADNLNTINLINLDKLTQDVDVDNKNFTGIILKQYLYIDKESNSLNTGLINMGPIIPVLDDKGSFLFNRTYFWLYH